MGWRDRVDAELSAVPTTSPEEQARLQKEYEAKEAQRAINKAEKESSLAAWERQKLEDQQKKERRIKAKQAVREARALVDSQINRVGTAKAVVAKEEALLAECESVLKLAQIELETADPRLRGKTFSAPFPSGTSQSGRILMLCTEARTTQDIAESLEMSYAQANTLLSGLYRTGFMEKPNRGWYQTLFTVLVHYGLRQWDEYNDDGMDPV